MKTSVYFEGKKVKGAFPLSDFSSGEEVGIFETLRAYGSKIFREREHLARLVESAHTAGYPFPVDRMRIQKELRAALGAYSTPSPPKGGRPFLVLRVSLWKGKVWVMIGRRRRSEKIFRTGVRLQTSPVKRTHPNAVSAQVKTSAFHNGLWAGLEPRPGGIDEWLILDGQGGVTECLVGNIMIIKKNRLLTPPEHGILRGITRGVVIECAIRNGLGVGEVPLTRHDIYNAEEAFLTNTSWEILPVRAVDGRRIGGPVPGPLTAQLEATLQHIIQEECL